MSLDNDVVLRSISDGMLGVGVIDLSVLAVCIRPRTANLDVFGVEQEI